MTHSHKAVTEAYEAKVKCSAAAADLCKGMTATHRAAEKIPAAAGEIRKAAEEMGEATTAEPVFAAERCVEGAELHKAIAHVHRNPKEREASGTNDSLSNRSRAEALSEFTPTPEERILECGDVSPLSVAPTRRRALEGCGSLAVGEWPAGRPS